MVSGREGWPLALDQPPLINNPPLSAIRCDASHVSASVQQRTAGGDFPGWRDGGYRGGCGVLGVALRSSVGVTPKAALKARLKLLRSPNPQE